MFFLTADGAEILSCTARALKEGHVVGVPTDTIYGLACLAQNSEAVRKTYGVKGRNGHKPLAICVGEIQDIYKYVYVERKTEICFGGWRRSDIIKGLSADSVIYIISGTSVNHITSK